jgi:hypothetical protein
LYAAYQKVVSQTGSGKQGDTDRVLSAADSLRDKAQSYMKDTESSRQQWFERESEIERVMDRVAEMEESEPDKTEQIREVIEKIQAKAYEGNYGESTRAADMFLPKFDPIYEDYLRRMNESPTIGDELGEAEEEELQLGEYGNKVPVGEYSGEQPGRPYGSNTTPPGYGGGGPDSPGPDVPLGEYGGEEPLGGYSTE